MNFPVQSLVMPILPEIVVLKDYVIRHYQTKILSRIGKEFFSDEENCVLKMELFRPLSLHSALFQVNSLVEIESDSEERIFIPRRAKFFILNLSPNDHKFQIFEFYEIRGLIFDNTSKKHKEEKDKTVFLEGICVANNDLDNCPTLLNYFIFYNTILFRKKEKAFVLFGQAFCFEEDYSEQYFKKGCVLLEFKPEGFIWYYPATTEISLEN